MARPAPSTDAFGMTFVPTSHDHTYPFIDPAAGRATDLKVLITGSSKGIGAATAISFAKSGASAIALLARSDLDQIAQNVLDAARRSGHPEPKLLKLRASTTDAEAVQNALRMVEREFGHLDVVINNASRMEAWRPVGDTDIDDWWSTWEVNLKGTFLVTRSAIPVVLKSKHKTIVVITSAGGLATT
jgi:NAD(P)-dependent dehydrogenase (short-subunit alcohol dehydrogenase family)